ncbi:MAG: ATP-binding protein [Symploca sp. SIO2D2]|nr:ATP-binding protein [Symploca sp. SIO2D2]
MSELRQKLTKTRGGKNVCSSVSTPSQKTKEVENLLKSHEGGWLYTLCTSRKVLIIEGEQGSFKSYTAALIAYLRHKLKGHKFGWLVDSDYHQNKDKSWGILQSLGVDAYGSHKNGEGLREGIQRFLDGIEARDEDTFPTETVIIDELTTLADYPECEGMAKSFMKFALSAPRKANYGLILITHALTNEGTGKGGGMAKARERGCLHLLLQADNDYNPTFCGVLNGFKLNGELQENLKITLPDWFGPDKIKEML